MGVALVTGASGGLGRSLCHELASRGFDLVLLDLDEGKLLSIADGLKCMHGVKCEILPLDLADDAKRAGLCKDIEAGRWDLSGLVNCAGTESEGRLADIPRESLLSILRINVIVTTDLMRSAIAAHKDGSRLFILNMSSMAAFNPMPFKAAYSSSKRYLLNISQAVAAEMKGSGVTVTAFCPAGIPTNPGTVERIRVQGFWGAATMMEVGRAAYVAIEAATRGKTVVVPGALNNLVRVASAITPRGISTAFIARRWRRVRASTK